MSAAYFGIGTIWLATGLYTPDNEIFAMMSPIWFLLALVRAAQ